MRQSDKKTPELQRILVPQEYVIFRTEMLETAGRGAGGIVECKRVQKHTSDED